MVGTLEYHNFDIRGDPRWAKASRFTRCAPLVVLTLFVLSIIQIVLGAVWVVDLKSEMTIPKILQTLVLPGLEFFNTLPSLHLHMLARGNPPKLAIWFSSSLALLWLTSCLLWLTVCSNSVNASQGLRQAECARGTFGLTYGPSKGIWGVVVALGLISTVLYACHAGMAVYVLKTMEREKKDEPSSSEPVPVDPAIALEARIRWARASRWDL